MRVLVVEDDPAILRGLRDNLEEEGYDVRSAADGEQGLLTIREWHPDLVVLDLMLPKMNGYEVCRRARAEGFTEPILVLTARGEEGDLVLGLDLGADDYVTKPFSIRELLARIRAHLRRSHPPRPLPERLAVGDFEVDFLSYAADRRGEPVAMTPKEFGLLRHLAARPGEVVSRQELLDEVWGYNAFPTTRTVDNHVASLRAKLEEDPANPEHLLTVHGVGYKWVP